MMRPNYPPGTMSLDLTREELLDMLQGTTCLSFPQQEIVAVSRLVSVHNYHHGPKVTVVVAFGQETDEQ